MIEPWTSDMRIRKLTERTRLQLHSVAAGEGITIGHWLDALMGGPVSGECPWPGCKHDHRWHVALRDKDRGNG